MLWCFFVVFTTLFLLLVLDGPSHADIHRCFITKEEAYNGMLTANIRPRFHVADGDTVIFNTVMLMGGELAPHMSFDEMFVLRSEFKGKGLGIYAFTGPFFINGAAPGDTLQVDILRIQPGAFSVTHIYPDSAGMGGLPEGFEKGWIKPLFLSKDRKTIEYLPGITLPVCPFLGTMAVAPRLGETYSPALPGYYAGNMDNKELTVGTTLYVPINVPGALFMAADAHALQGDGEISIAAAETYFEEVEVRFIVRKDIKLTMPIGETPTHWITMSFHRDLDEAMKGAIRETVSFLMRAKKLSREEAYALCSLAVDFRITQVVDGDKGIHAMIPKNIFK